MVGIVFYTLFLVVLLVVFHWWIVNILKIDKDVALTFKKKKVDEEKANKNTEKSQDKQDKEEYQKILNKYKNYIDKFCEIADREISSLDEWGDENTKSIDKLKQECISRIARNVYSEDYEKDRAETNHFINEWFRKSHLDEDVIELDMYSTPPFWVRKLWSEYLSESLKIYRSKKSNTKTININLMDGRSFEIYIGGLLKGEGYRVSGTPTTGDQGADLIAIKNSKSYVIQAKRWTKPVGNKAVQEVVAAKNYYKGDIPVVVTNSTFTNSAKALAQRNKVILVDGHKITIITKILENHT